MTLRPIVRKGQRVEEGEILTEGYSSEGGELALGRNLKVAYMPWKGYNYEDAIVISENIVRNDVFTSVHVDEYSLEVRETKRGLEELTADIPNVSEDATKDLDENGIIRIGARVKPGDILIGKITPKGESDPSPEEKLLRAIFGDKAGDVKDASLKASPSLSGVIIDKKLLQRMIGDRKSKAAGKTILAEIDEQFERKVGDLTDLLIDKLFELTNGKFVSDSSIIFFTLHLSFDLLVFDHKVVQQITDHIVLLFICRPLVRIDFQIIQILQGFQRKLRLSE